jgi:hypothetical protein
MGKIKHKISSLYRRIWKAQHNTRQDRCLGILLSMDNRIFFQFIKIERKIKQKIDNKKKIQDRNIHFSFLAFLLKRGGFKKKIFKLLLGLKSK